MLFSPRTPRTKSSVVDFSSSIERQQQQQQQQLRLFSSSVLGTFMHKVCSLLCRMLFRSCVEASGMRVIIRNKPHTL